EGVAGGGRAARAAGCAPARGGAGGADRSDPGDRGPERDGGGMNALPKLIEGARFAIRTTGPAKRYGRAVALRGIDLTVPEGAVHVLVGPNGAGKSTALKILLVLVRADSGEAEVLGRDSRADGPRIRGRVGYVPEAQKWEHEWMNVGQLLDHHARYYPSWDRDYATRLSSRLELDRKRPYG